MKYANASIIKIDFSEDKKLITVEIKDDGEGFDPETTEMGNGILNMKNRINEIGGDIKIHSDSTEGTSIMVSFYPDYLIN